MRNLTVRVYGAPAPQGSKRHVGNGVMVESSKRVKPWRTDIVEAARTAIEADGWTPPVGPARVSLNFIMPRPRSHYRTGKAAHLLREASPDLHSSRPDIDKLSRAALDALTTAGVLRDDSQVAQLSASKEYGDGDVLPGLIVSVWEAKG